MKYEWIEPDWRKHEGLCYFETGKDKEWRVSIFGSTRGGYDITVHYRRAYQVFKYIGSNSEFTLATAKERGEKIFEEIKSSING